MNKSEFLSLSTNVGVDTTANRQILLDKFDIIDAHIDCAHDTSEIYYMANFALRNQNSIGSIIEFGSYKGGMSCKLSHLAKLLDKQVLIYDTFQGLVEDVTYTRQPDLADNESVRYDFQKGMYTGTMQEINENLHNYGEILVCSYVPGDIRQSIFFNPITASLVSVDLDHIDTMKFVIKEMWNKITTGLIFFHESCLVEINSLYGNEFKEYLNDDNIVFGHEFFGTNYSLPNTNCLNFVAKNDVNLNEIFTGNSE